MGMDLLAAVEGSSFHANWTGWSLLCDAVDALGCDTSQLSGSNDGDWVDEPTARSFAAALRAGIDRLYLLDLAGADVFSRGRCVLEGPGLEAALSVPQSRASAVRHSPGLVEWLLSFAAFCDESGGFGQY